MQSASACSLGGVLIGNILNQDAHLETLGYNGGGTFTHALLTGSPAIDGGDDSTCPTTDQRGVTRAQINSCDIGAYEFEMQSLYLPFVTH